MSFEVNISDNSAELLRELEKKKQAALEAIGVTAESYCKLLVPVDTGRLRSSMTHSVKGDDVYIGTNVEYAMWLELGTGIYASDGKGRQSPWGYYDRDGKYHRTRGTKPRHMLKKAASEHTEEYKRIIENQMKG